MFCTSYLYLCICRPHSDVATLSLGFTMMHATLVITPLVMFVYTACVCVCVCVCFGGYFCSFVFLPLLPVCCSFFVVQRVLIWKEILLAVLSLCMFEAWIASASGKGSAPGVVLTFFTACLNFFIHSPSSSGGYTQQ